MPISHDTLRLADHLRVRVDRQVDDTTRILVQAWARAWEQVNFEWAAAIGELIEVGDGRWPTRRQIARATRAQQALALTYDKVVQLASLAGVTVSTSARTVTSETAFWQARIIASQIPPGIDQAQVAARLDRVDPAALEWIVDRTTQQVTALHKPLTDDMTEAMKRTLVRGIAVGDNPRKTAADMLRRLEHQFNGGLTRALVITRTEMLDAHRAAAQAQQMANADALAGWYWHAKLDRRTCPSCWAQHGRLHELDEAGPLDHQQGRCSRLPKLKTWSDLGFEGIDEPDDDLVDARTAFGQLPYADQLAVMGRKRLAALNAGEIGWDDLSVRHSTDGWRDSYRVATFRGLADRTNTGTGSGGTGSGGVPPVLQPSGGGQYNLGDTLARHLIGADSDQATQAAIDAIATVHGVDAIMPKLPMLEFTEVVDADGNQRLGGYSWDGTTGRSVVMSINTVNQTKTATLIHELGHFLDHKGLGDPLSFVSAAHPMFNDWRRAIADTATFQTLLRQLQAGPDPWTTVVNAAGVTLTWRPDQEFVAYLMQPVEMFARTYAQWIALRSGIPGLEADVLDNSLPPMKPDWELISGERPGSPRQWQPEEFEPIAQALDELFDSLGLLRRPRS